MIDGSRIALDLIYETLRYNLSTDLGISGSSIYIASPDHMYINERTEEINNRDDTRFPCITIEPYRSKLVSTQHNPHQIYGEKAITGISEYWYSDLRAEEVHYFTIETSTKYDWRKYNHLMMLFFNKHKNGMTLINDVLPNNYKDSFSIWQERDTIFDLQNAPFRSTFKINIHYSIFIRDDKYRVNQFITDVSYNMDQLVTGNTEVILTPQVEG